MERYGKTGRIYTLEEIHHRIDSVARKKLGISGIEAIKVINSGDWENKENRGNILVWLWLKGFADLLSNDIPERGAKDARIQQKTQRAIQ
jgi:hypothetical protein